MIISKHSFARTITLTFLSCWLVGAPMGALAQPGKDVPGSPTAPSAGDIGIPNWQDAAKARKWGLPLRVLPDLDAHAEVTEDSCLVNLWIRNNSPNGISRDQWANPEDTVRVELWNVDEATLDDDHNLTYSFVDPLGNLRRPRGESVRFPWRVNPGKWELRLYVDITSDIRELTERNNIATAYAICDTTD